MLPRMHAAAPSLKLQTVERVREYLEHYAPSTYGAKRVVGCNRSLALRFPGCISGKRTLAAFVSGMVAKCEGRERMLVALGHFSSFPNSLVKGHAQKLQMH